MSRSSCVQPSKYLGMAIFLLLPPTFRTFLDIGFRPIHHPVAGRYGGFRSSAMLFRGHASGLLSTDATSRAGPGAGVVGRMPAAPCRSLRLIASDDILDSLGRHAWR